MHRPRDAIKHSPASAYYIKRGAFGLAAASAVILGILSVALSWLLVPAHASAGAALATLTTMALGFMLALGMLALISGRSSLRVFIPDFSVEAAALKDLLRKPS